MKEMWDKKAANYPRFTGEPSVFQRGLYAKIAEFGVKFAAVFSSLKFELNTKASKLSPAL